MRSDLIDYEATHDPIEHAPDAWLYHPTRAEWWAGLVVQVVGLMCGLSIGASLLAALAALGALEHVFLLLPVRDGALWGWALPSHKAGRPVLNFGRGK